jgi:hypothetical protein
MVTHRKDTSAQDYQVRSEMTAAAILQNVASGRRDIESGMFAYGVQTAGGVPRGQRKMTSPPAEIVIKARRWMGITLMGLGVVEFVVHFFLPYNGTALATQTPVGTDSVGRVRQTPTSYVVSRMYPQMNIAIGSLVAGAMLFVTMHYPAFRTMFFEQCVNNLSYIVHLQACFQSMIIIITVLPLAGVVNIYELAFATVLTVAQFLIYLFSDMSNQTPIKHWEFVDAYGDVGEPPERSFHRACPHETPVLGFQWMPVVSGVVLFVFTWSIVFIHLVLAFTASTYSVEADFAAVVILTAALQMLIPITKIVQLARPALLVSRTMCTYKFVVASIDAIEFVNMVIVGVVLMYAYWSVPS